MLRGVTNLQLGVVAGAQELVARGVDDDLRAISNELDIHCPCTLALAQWPILARSYPAATPRGEDLKGTHRSIRVEVTGRHDVDGLSHPVQVRLVRYIARVSGVRARRQS